MVRMSMEHFCVGYWQHACTNICMFTMTTFSILSFYYDRHVAVRNCTSIHHYESAFFVVTKMHTNETLALSAFLVSISFLARMHLPHSVLYRGKTCTNCHNCVCLFCQQIQRYFSLLQLQMYAYHSFPWYSGVSL